MLEATPIIVGFPHQHSFEMKMRLCNANIQLVFKISICVIIHLNEINTTVNSDTCRCFISILSGVKKMKFDKI